MEKTIIQIVGWSRNTRILSRKISARCLLIAMFFAYQACWAEDWSEKIPVEVILDDHAGYTQHPSMALAPDGTVYIIYEEEEYNSSHRVFRKKIWARIFEQGSSQFSKATLLQRSKDLGASDVNVDADGNVHLVWSDAEQCVNSNVVGHKVVLYYQKYDKELQALTEPIRLTENCSNGMGFGFEDNSLSTDANGNTHILHHLGYFVVGPIGEQLHSERYSFEHYFSQYPYRTDIKSDDLGNTFLAWYTRGPETEGVVHTRVVRSAVGKPLMFGEVQSIKNLGKNDVKRIRVTYREEEVFVQIDTEDCSSFFSVGTPVMLRRAPFNMEEDGTQVYRISIEGTILGKELMPPCGYLDNRDGQLWAHYIPISSLSCGVANMEIHHSKALYGETPEPSKHIVAIHPYPSADHGPAFWDESVLFDQQGGVHLAWFLNNGLNRYKVQYLKLDPDGIPEGSIIQIAP